MSDVENFGNRPLPMWLKLRLPENIFYQRGAGMEILTTKQAAMFLGVSMAFLERDRWLGAQVPFVRIGVRTIRYLRSDLENYIEEHRVAVRSFT